MEILTFDFYKKEVIVLNGKIIKNNFKYNKMPP